MNAFAMELPVRPDEVYCVAQVLIHGLHGGREIFCLLQFAGDNCSGLLVKSRYDGLTHVFVGRELVSRIERAKQIAEGRTLHQAQRYHFFSHTSRNSICKRLPLFTSLAIRCWRLNRVGCALLNSHGLCRCRWCRGRTTRSI